MLEKEKGNIEAVVIAVPLSQHFKIAKDCLEAGLHVLTEKLMCWSVDAVQGIDQCREGQ